MTSFKNILFIATSSLFVFACGSKRDKPVDKEATFFVKSISPGSPSVMKKNQATSEVTKLYNFSACLQDVVLKSPILGVDFGVSDGQSEKIIKSDINDGCLRWTETHVVNSGEEETFYKVKRTFTGKEVHTGQVTLELAFNPWTDSLIDLRYEKPAAEKLVEVDSFAFNTDLQKVKSQVNRSTTVTYINSMSLNFEGQDYDNYRVNSLLTLQGAQLFTIKISPSLLRRTLDSSIDSVSVRGGQVRLIMYILTSKNQLISSVDETLDVDPNDGSAHKQISVRFTDPSLISSRMNVIVKIQALMGENSSIQPGVYRGILSPLKSTSASIDLTMADEKTLANLVAAEGQVDSLNASFASTQSGLQLFTKGGRFQEIKVASVQQNLRGKGYVDLATLARKKLDSKLSAEDEVDLRTLACKKIADKNCKNMEIVQLSFVEKLNNPKPRPVDYAREYSLRVANGFEYSKSYSQDVSASAKVGASASIGFDLSKLLWGLPTTSPIEGGSKMGFGLSAGGDAGWAIARRSGQGSSTSISAGEDLSISAIGNTFEIEAQVRKCLVIKMKEAATGSYVCSNNLENKTIRETYYLVNQNLASSALSDADDFGSVRWRMTIRGSEQFEVFKNLVSDKNIFLEFIKFDGMALTELPQDLLVNNKWPSDLLVNQAFPGAISE